MKRIPIFLLFLIISCTPGRDEVIQDIDQRLQFYIQDQNGQDLLIPGDSLGYAGSINLFDLNADRVNVPISGITYKLDSTSMHHYMEYIGGATRILADSIDEGKKIYFSDYLMTMKKNMQAAVADSDTVHIVYQWTPALFQVSQVEVNKKTVFTKNSDSQNKIILVK